jgi:hypothetical protein
MLHYSGRPRHRSGDDRVLAMFPVNRDCYLVLGVEIPSTLLARADEMIELAANCRLWHETDVPCRSTHVR